MPIRIPTLPGQQVEQRPAGARQTPLSFAGGDEGSAVGQALVAGGRVLGEIGELVAEQQYRDDVRTSDQKFVAIATQMDEIETDYTVNRRGGAALPEHDAASRPDAFPGVTTDYVRRSQEIFERETDGLNQRTKQLASKRFEQFLLSGKSKLEKHEAVQRHIESVNSDNAVIEINNRKAVDAFADPDEVRIWLNDSENIINATEGYETDEQRELANLQNRSKVWSEVINTLGDHDPMAAASLAVNVRDELGEEAFANLTKVTEEKRVIGVSQDVVDEVFGLWKGAGGELSANQIEAGIRGANLSPAEEKASLALFREQSAAFTSNIEREQQLQNDADAAAIRERKAAEDWEGARKIASKSRDVAFSEKEMQGIRNAELGKSEITDTNRYLELVELANADPNAFRRIDLTKEPLDDADFGKMRQMKEDIILGKPLSPTGVTGSSFASIASAMIKAESLDAEDAALFKQRFSQDVAALGEKPSPEDMWTAARAIVSQIAAPWFGFNPKGFEVDLNDFSRYDLDAVTIERIPLPVRRASRANLYERFGRAPTDAEIVKDFIVLETARRKKAASE